MPSQQELEPARLVIIYGRGDGDDTLARAQAGLEYAETHPDIEGIVLSGGHSKWQPTPPSPGISEAGLMLNHIKARNADIPILGCDRNALDTFDNAANTAKILGDLGIQLGSRMRVAMPSGKGHGPRMHRLTALATGVSDERAVIDRIHVDEDDRVGLIVEWVGRQVLEAAIDHVGGVMPGDLEQLERAHQRFDTWNTGLQGDPIQKIRAALSIGGSVALQSFAALGRHYPGAAGYYEH